MALLKYNEFINEAGPSPRFPHALKSESYWRNVAYGDKFLNDVLDSVFKRQGGFASERQFQVLKRKELGIKTPYHTKN